MKKYLIAAVALLVTSSAMALDYEPKQGMTWQTFLGLTTSHIKNTPYEGKVGGTAGFKLEYTLPKAHGTYISTGVDWIMKGGKFQDAADPALAEMGVDGKFTSRLHYIEIPVRAGFHYNLNREFGFFGEFGPYFSVGVGGKNALDIDADGPGFREVEKALTHKAFKDDQNSTHTQFQRWDAGLGFRVGAEYNQHYSLTLGCDWGITDMYRDSYRDIMHQVGLGKAHNFAFIMALGYRF
ncbi:MAG: PorT family protein [Bacteroidaceae bacterium]|nr:PorT family protein [Bacteroidaceae bacterium]